MFNFFHRRHKPDLFWTTDVHSHVCPGIDDGAVDASAGSSLVGRMADMGFRSMVVTPHVTEDIFPNTPDIIDASLVKLRAEMEKNGVEMKITPSAEYRMDDLFYQMLKEGNVRPLPGGTHILVENGWREEPYGIEALAYKLRNEHGWIPVLAHPERYLYYHLDPSRYLSLKDAGFLFQVNLLSLSGAYGKKVKKIAEELLAEDMVSFIGSDIHRLEHTDSIDAYLRSADFRKLARQSSSILNDKVLTF